MYVCMFTQDASGVYVFVEMPSVVAKYKIHYIFDILYFKILLFYCLRPWRAAIRLILKKLYIKTNVIFFNHSISFIFLFY